ncbi:helix-turn-helix domain-containing protein [Actinotalea sp. C106]|uniref:AraC family transcriptional regulator n=1 Tax=Actinotalea sp. C106 TaxID=2908644 RepID=UPI002027B649|nr:helix-turn-helix domain-containing protein [Actinotalea sp. C106]
MALRDGFENQRLCVVPRPLVTAALARPITRRLVVSDAGWFPRAADHARERPRGTEETIVIVCVAGAGWAHLSGSRHRIGAGSALLVPAGEPHAYGASEIEPWTIWWCHLRGTDLRELVAGTGATSERPVIQLRAVDRVVALLAEIVSNLERDQSPARLLGTAGVAWNLLTLLATDQLTGVRGDPLERAMSYLADRLDSPITVADLAALVGVSPSHLSALVHRATGGGVIAHHTALRMARARHLLDTTDQAVGVVAREVGYTDPFYFSRLFRRTHGESPSQYRAHHKG